jgi:hypothetical protein
MNQNVRKKGTQLVRHTDSVQQMHKTKETRVEFLFKELIIVFRQDILTYYEAGFTFSNPSGHFLRITEESRSM